MLARMGYEKDTLGRALLTETERRLFDESMPRLRRCLQELSVDEIWHRPNEQTPSVGNLVLHLAGNVNQWIVATLGGAPDVRNRPLEFAERGPLPTSELLGRLEAVMADARKALRAFDPGRLLEKRAVQCFEETGVSILVHVAEHFSYHVGQITYVVKSRKNIDLNYYPEGDLSATRR